MCAGRSPRKATEARVKVQCEEGALKKREKDEEDGGMKNDSGYAE